MATVVDGGPQIGMARPSEDLYSRGVRRLMVEGGEKIHAQFLAAGLADELQLVEARPIGDAVLCALCAFGKVRRRSAGRLRLTVTHVAAKRTTRI
ncbi:dihydrofolate reductase family protein [Arthrobacter sp. H35-D1]|uniref:dihydrofolate reductase family protein n=1 Tax=Arthrobacter sp. H35-D1 TaxID=3046202 RepID=UPI0024B9D9BC|nr:dihydrofolate reductase family protein [Arthrobacter sp. H35-D1]MDJ0314264.1 dihydrofolate reductase family protein [Arthrobacter sp. H35-D1]